MTNTQTVLGGDDVHAIVADCGSYHTRFGSAGDDTPRCIIPSAVGSRPSLKRRAEDSDEIMTDVNAAPPLPPRLSAGDVLLQSPLSFTDISPVYDFDDMGKGTVRDWDSMLQVWDAACQSLRLKPNTSPFMIVEPARGWPDDARASALERAFEGLGVPAAYLARGCAMAAFASARTTACVVDVGYQGAVSVPVVDGYMLKKGIMATKVGGLYLTQKLMQWTEDLLRGRPNYEGAHYEGKGERLRAHHELKKERLVADAGIRKFRVEDLTERENFKALSDGHRAFYRMRIVDEIKAHTFRVSQGKTLSSNEGATAGKEPVKPSGGTGMKGKAKDSGEDGKDGGAEKDTGNGNSGKQSQNKDKMPSLTRTAEYELPDGNMLSFMDDEIPSFADELFTTSGTDKVSLSELAYRTATACDIDVRRDLYAGVVLTGGTSLISGTVERFTRELAVKTPQMYKLKVLASSNGTERNCGTWIGGSIVASLGTFQQVWVSKAEYDELGSRGALRKCP
eukprot:GFKZ01011621.1.p1 GENE.GFKZ01011621.1~~GFKZ01011621.1.p1  ORF type:complete len:508 (-),score=76.68 GFKZ01011621.1:2856-4379(-)